MAADFTPFTQALKARVLSATTGHETSHFRAVGNSNAPVPKSLAAEAPPSSDGSAVPHAAVNIELKRDGDRVSQIRIHCRCGELIEIECDY